MMILLVGKRRTPEASGIVAAIRAHGASPSHPPSSASGAVGLVSPTTAPPPSARAADVPLCQGGVRAAMMGNLPMSKHVVRDIDGASRESDAAIECEMEKHFNHLLLGKADVQR